MSNTVAIFPGVQRTYAPDRDWLAPGQENARHRSADVIPFTPRMVRDKLCTRCGHSGHRASQCPLVLTSDDGA